MKYNKLFLIGNGFDLAHGLKTKYSDFILWYLNKTIRKFKASDSDKFSDSLVIFDSKYEKISEFDSLESVKQFLKRSNFKITFRNTYTETLFNKFIDLKWVDIEYEYYQKLIEIYNNNEKYKNVSNYDFEKKINELNECFAQIKIELLEYLKTINISSEYKSEKIENHLKNEINNANTENVLFLVFNYTNTLDLYLDSFKNENIKVIYIHGKLNDDKNPLIFGYGDEMDDYYSKLERENSNGYLKFMKSFNYLKTNNYLTLHHFINSNYYNINIMGHSCGISDRVLLNSIFTAKYCNFIRIFYYQKDVNENDFFEKTQEISRHFKSEDKGRMRIIIVPESKSLPLT
jgi:hypothetical protein